jgi:uncharacterized protein (TIGR02453 family)
VPGVADRFTGFPLEALEFLEDLELHNERAWFHAHKDSYDRACKEPMEKLLAELTARYGAGKIFRIHRDIRFSKDKTPYKTYVSATFGGGSYLSLSPGGFYVGTGGYMLDGTRLARYREAVAADAPGKDLEKIAAALAKKGYDVGGHGEMKVVPRGFPRDHERADLLRQKSVFVGKSFAIEPWLATRKAMDRVHKVITDARPMTDWIAAYVDS